MKNKTTITQAKFDQKVEDLLNDPIGSELIKSKRITKEDLIEKISSVLKDTYDIK
jgi:exo-beta-1,3-glucanase (GH17 family)